jgi:YD repeat-containing protein
LKEQGDRRNFWHPPAWKWAVAFFLIASSFLLLFQRSFLHSLRVQRQPFPDPLPEWNGSYPYLIVALTDSGSSGFKCKTSIQLVEPTVRHDAPVNEFQVDLHSGMFVVRQTDLFVSDVIPISLTRTYRDWDLSSRAFGTGGNHSYDICPTGTRFPYTYMDLNLEDDRQIHFRRISKGTGYADAVFGHDQTASEFYGAEIAWNGNGWPLALGDGRQFLFPEAYHAQSYAQGAPIEMRDANGHRMKLQRDSQRNLELLISPSGKTITFNYDGADRISTAIDDLGNVRKYSYDPAGHLETVANASHVLYHFDYAALLNSPGYDPYVVKRITDGTGRVLLQNSYEDGGQVSAQKLANGDIYKYEYIFVKNEIVETIVDGPNGKVRLFFRQGRFLREE